MNKKMQAAATTNQAKSENKSTEPDGSCCTAPPDGDTGPIKP